MELLYKNEKPLFTIMLVLSLLIWGLILFATKGLALAYVVFFALFYLFAQSGFISYLKGTGVEITAEQFPDLHQKIVDASAKLGMGQVPAAYLLHANGAFNALATRFMGKNFIVLFSDIVDALEEQSDALNFYIGHELAHLKRKHLLWGPLLMPASFLPLLGTAYSRAKEYTCDRHGQVVCANPQSAQMGLAALAAGGKRWRTMSQDHYIAQTRESSGFWMSLYELISDYPWLTKRAAALRAMAEGRQDSAPGRHKLAWVLALFIPRFGLGGAASGLVLIAMIGVLAAIAIPAYHDYSLRASVAQAVTEGNKAAAAVQSYYERNRRLPDSLKAVGYSLPPNLTSVQGVELDQEDAVLIITLGGSTHNGKVVKLVPRLDKDKRIFWKCESSEIAQNLLPQSCR